jgi:hypothetical protein
LGLATVERLVRAAQGTLMGRQIQGGFVVEATFNAPPIDAAGRPIEAE